MSTIRIERRLEVIGDNKLMVPGCEPSSALTSVRLMIEQRRDGSCGSSVVNLQDALDAIPGSTIIYGSNFNSPRKRWFVLPPFDPEACPCQGEPDWYGVLRSLSREEAPATEKFDHCNIIGTGFCPSPDFKTNKVGPYGRAADGGAPVGSYFDEGDNSIFGNYST